MMKEDEAESGQTDRSINSVKGCSHEDDAEEGMKKKADKTDRSINLVREETQNRRREETG
jgi:hypothetical protein